jgi:hypothetical protein
VSAGERTKFGRVEASGALAAKVLSRVEHEAPEVGGQQEVGVAVVDEAAGGDRLAGVHGHGESRTAKRERYIGVVFNFHF